MNVTIVDYKSGNISSVINSFKEVAQSKIKIEVTSDVSKIESSDKVVLPGQGSFKSRETWRNGYGTIQRMVSIFFTICRNYIAYWEFIWRQ